MNNTQEREHACLIAKYNSVGKFMELAAVNCLEEHLVICRKVLFVKPKCKGKSSFYGGNVVELMLDSRNNLYRRQVLAYKKAEVKDMMERLNQGSML